VIGARQLRVCTDPGAHGRKPALGRPTWASPGVAGRSPGSVAGGGGTHGGPNGAFGDPSDAGTGRSTDVSHNEYDFIRLRNRWELSSFIAGVHHMPEPHSRSTGPWLMPIERPRCPKCISRMKLASIVPGPRGYDLRNFECEKCDHVDTLAVATDPMKSEKWGWLAGEMKPPK
jgi:hypothetical protein